MVYIAFEMFRLCIEALIMGATIVNGGANDLLSNIKCLTDKNSS